MTTDITSHIASVFESFNARSLAPEQVAKTFIPPPVFHSLTARCHSTVIGPRGSGKTSLLKMIQPSALENWDSIDAEEYRKRVDYTGVFIPTDVSWNRQTVAIVEGLSSKMVKLFRGAAFTTHVLHELIEVLNWRCDKPKASQIVPFRRTNLLKDKERLLVRELADSWILKPTTESLIGLKHSLGARHVAIWSLAQRASLTGASIESLPEWMTLDFLSCCGQAVELFDDAIGESNARWALLFDELELAPEWIMQGLLSGLRSTNEKLLFKLAVSPFNERYEMLKSAIQPVPDQDYNEIRLWHANKEDGLEFSQKLFLSVCRDRGVKVDKVADLVGQSFLDMDTAGTKSYERGSSQYRTLAKALRTDTTFHDYWCENNLSLDSLSELSEEERAAKVRKIYPLVLIRNFFRVPPNSRLAGKQARRSRKSIEVYTGAASLLTISEGNPRWIIGLTRLLLNRIDSAKLPIKRSDQGRILEETIHKFRARLKTISLDASTPKLRSKTLLGFLDIIGTYFKDHVVIERFTPQPPLSFTVDTNAHPSLITAIGRAVNSGAIVYVPDKGSIGLLNDMKGKRFRLSYLLAPYFNLPLRLGDSASIFRILSGKSSTEDDDALMLNLKL